MVRDSDSDSGGDGDGELGDGATIVTLAPLYPTGRHTVGRPRGELLLSLTEHVAAAARPARR